MFALKPRMRKTWGLLPREMPFGWLPEEFGTLFNRLTGPVPETGEWPYGWALTTEEKEGEFVVRAEMPGFTPEEVKVELVGGRLKVEAEHKEVEEGEKEKAERYEHVKRVVTLPPEIEAEKVEAIYRNGVLEVHVPRKTEAVRPIEVKT